MDDLYFSLSSAQQPTNVVVEGVIDEVCKVKGCWLTLKAEEGASMRVTFKDYGFFVPKNISGRKVALKGNGIVSITSVDDQKHYAKDARKSDEEIAEITEPLQEYTFEASGVQLLD